jgi:glycosyltransferase involved in cell wall biosynthesis
MSAPPIRVAFDVTSVIAGSTGIARYVNELSASLDGGGAELRRFALGRQSFPAPSGTRHLPVPARIVARSWKLTGWPRAEQLVRGADVVHATGLLVPATRRPLVVTVHDVAALRHPELHPARHVRAQRGLVSSLDRAAGIVAVSAATADDLVQLGVPGERITVAPLGLSHMPPPVSEGRPPPGYLLTVGETARRKRYDVLLRALVGLGPDVRLVMAGPPAADDERLSQLVSELGLTDRVRRLGSVSDAQLSGLYEGALALCFPSVAEGFGLPVLEAMAWGTPVLVSDLPVMRELAGDAAVYIPVDGPSTWADAISGVIEQPALREALSAAGRRRAGEFTWEKAARRTREAYALALEAGNRLSRRDAT